MSSPLRTESRLGGSLVGLCAVALLALGCSDDFIEAGCDGALSAVVKGEVRNLPVDIEALDVKGQVSDTRFHLAFDAPESLRSENIGDWLVEFGFNPLGGTSTTATLREEMNDWFSQRGGPKPFQVTSKDPGDPCDPSRGDLCGGFGVDTNANGEVDAGIETLNEERYHRFVTSEDGGGGVVEFDILTPEEWRARFRLDIHWDEDDSTIPGGSIEGCFHALLVPKGDIREMVAPSKGGR